MVVAALVVAAAVVVVLPEAAAFDAVFLLPQPAAKIATATRSASEPTLNLIFDLPLSTRFVSTAVNGLSGDRRLTDAFLQARR